MVTAILSIWVFTTSHLSCIDLIYSRIGIVYWADALQNLNFKGKTNVCTGLHEKFRWRKLVALKLIYWWKRRMGHETGTSHLIWSISYILGSQSVVRGPLTSSSPESLWETRTLRPHLTPVGSEDCRAGIQQSVATSPPGDSEAGSHVTFTGHSFRLLGSGGWGLIPVDQDSACDRVPNTLPRYMLLMFSMYFQVDIGMRSREIQTCILVSI